MDTKYIISSEDNKYSITADSSSNVLINISNEKNISKEEFDQKIIDLIIKINLAYRDMGGSGLKLVKVEDNSKNSKECEDFVNKVNNAILKRSPGYNPIKYSIMFFLLAVFFWLAETAYFGWNWEAKSVAESYCNKIVWLILAASIIAKMRNK